MSHQLYLCQFNSDTQYVVLSLGLGGHGSFWQQQIAALQQYFHVLTE